MNEKGFCISNFMFNDKSRLDHTDLFSSNMREEESWRFRLRKIDESKHYSIEEIKQNDLNGEKYKKFILLYITLNSHWF